MIDTITEIEQEEASQEERMLPETLSALDKLAQNYWWSWAADGAAVFRDLDPPVWEQCEHNPRRLLQQTPEFRLMQMGADPVYTERVRRLAERFDAYVKGSPRTPSAQKITPTHPVAYFCAEYGIHNSLPLYSGGLGMLAGDHLKSASDIGLPLIAVGLLYCYGYFRQSLRRDGWQEEQYGEVDPADLPIQIVRDNSGERITVEVLMRDRLVRAQVWRADVGRIPLYLLDTNIPENDFVDRWVTGHLYGGDRETRVVQEMMLGIGGVRLLRRLQIEPAVFHLNEGHSAFLTLELAREIVTAKGDGQAQQFAEAAKSVRQRCVFTTHTPVIAGNDEFAPALIEQCFGNSFAEELGLTQNEFLALGRVDTGVDVGGVAEGHVAAAGDAAFGMTPLAIKMCRSTNGVSRKHGEVSRTLWHDMWPELDESNVPITHVTNGVHAPTWVAPLIGTLFEKQFGENWAESLSDAQSWAAGVEQIPDHELWIAHNLLKRRLVAFIRQRTYYTRQRRRRGETAEDIAAARTMFDPQALTIGFARRVAGYKRWNLLLSDPARLLRLISDAQRPVQFVFAGKAHPQDQVAKHILQQLTQWRDDPQVMHRAVFLQDYEQEMARQLVQGVDVWMNVPRRPLEASGTSGQKVGMNGGLNLSVLDGWWIEGYDGTNGWAISDEEVGEAETEDRRDAEALYRVLETQVVPAFYGERDANTGIPQQWIKMMKRSIATLTPIFNTDRMVSEYEHRIYAPSSRG